MASLSNRSGNLEAPDTPKLRDRRARVVRGRVDVTHRMAGGKIPIGIPFVLLSPSSIVSQPPEADRIYSFYNSDPRTVQDGGNL